MPHGQATPDSSSEGFPIAVGEPTSLPVFPQASRWVSDSTDGKARQATIKEHVRPWWASRGDHYGELVAKGVSDQISDFSRGGGSLD